MGVLGAFFSSNSSQLVFWPCSRRRLPLAQCSRLPRRTPPITGPPLPCALWTELPKIDVKFQKNNWDSYNCYIHVSSENFGLRVLLLVGSMEAILQKNHLKMCFHFWFEKETLSIVIQFENCFTNVNMG